MHRRYLASTLALAAFVTLATALPQSAEAHLVRRAAVARQAAGDFMLTNVTTLNGAVGGITSDCCVPEPISCCAVPCCKPNVCYQYRGCRKVCCDPCLPPIQQTLTFCHPATGCKVAVDICVPGCCTGCPKVTSRPTLIGCGAVTYHWCCGFSATFRFQKCGDVTVVYRGA